MGPKDRDYFMLRASQERAAAATSTRRVIRGRHEELAWLYEMRVIYIDRGLFTDEAETPGPESVQHIIIPA